MRLFVYSTAGDERRVVTDSLGIRDAEPPPKSASYSRTPSVQRDPYVRQCQKCQKPSEYPFGTFGTPSVSECGETIRCRRSSGCQSML